MGMITFVKLTDVHSVDHTCFFTYEPDASNSPYTDRGGVGICFYYGNDWISIIAIPYATTDIYIAEKRAEWSEWAKK